MKKLTKFLKTMVSDDATVSSRKVPGVSVLAYILIAFTTFAILIATGVINVAVFNAILKGLEVFGGFATVLLTATTFNRK